MFPATYESSLDSEKGKLKDDPTPIIQRFLERALLSESG
jgi:hypothetical protein